LHKETTWSTIKCCFYKLKTITGLKRQEFGQIITTDLILKVEETPKLAIRSQQTIKFK